MEGDRGHATILGDATGVEVGEMLIVDSNPEFHRDRDRTCRFDRGGDHVSIEVALERQGPTSAVAGDLADRTAEVQVDVIDPAFADQLADGLADIDRLDPGQLKAPRGLVGGEAGQLVGLCAALAHGSGRNHLADIQTGPKVATQPPKRGVCNPGHRGQHHRDIDRHRADGQLSGQPGKRRLSDRRLNG